VTASRPAPDIFTPDQLAVPLQFVTHHIFTIVDGWSRSIE
jgi:hypothetical protein